MSSCVLLGAPGAGKSTLGKFIESCLNMKQISSGDMLRHEIASKTEIGRSIQSIVEVGGQVSDELITTIVMAKLTELVTENKKFVSDGFPQTVAQLESLQAFMRAHPEYPISLICVQVKPETALKRMIGRIACVSCSSTYHKETSPPRVEGRCNSCEGELVVRKSDDAATAARRLEQFDKTTRVVMERVMTGAGACSISGDEAIEKAGEQLLKLLQNKRTEDVRDGSSESKTQVRGECKSTIPNV